MGFWILAALAAVFIVIALGFALLAPARRVEADTAEFDLRVYRDQLKELDKDLARGTLAPEEAERARVEISRRLLEADKAAKTAETVNPAPKAASAMMVVLMAAVLMGGGYWAYTMNGAPGYWDMPMEKRVEAAEAARKSRPSQAEAEAEVPLWDGPPEGTDPEYVDLVAQLRTAVSRRPNDEQGLTLLASHEAALGNFRAAANATSRLITLRGDNVPAQTYAQFGEFLVMSAGGYVSPEAEVAFAKALQIDPNDALSRYYSGLMLAQTGRPDLAFPLWRQLLERSPVDAPWVPVIRSQIEELAWRAGVNYTLPPAPGVGLPGPSGEDMEAAAEMSEEDRAAMIQSMVDRLSERLATEGGTPAEWARLISVLGVQGNLEKAAAIWAEAQATFAERPAELAMIREAAVSIGLEE